jgi:hypothetical protein
MSFAKSFERKFLFPLTRGLALLAIIGLLVVTVVVGMKASGVLISRSSKVDSSEVVQAITQGIKRGPDAATEGVDANASVGAEVDPLSGITISPEAQKSFSGGNRWEVIKEWLSIVPADERQEFLDELSDTIIQAGKAGIDRDTAANEYKRLKAAKLGKEEMEKQELGHTQLYFIGAAFGCVTLVALFSLVLLLLSIERNTRRE